MRKFTTYSLTLMLAAGNSPGEVVSAASILPITSYSVHVVWVLYISPLIAIYLTVVHRLVHIFSLTLSRKTSHKLSHYVMIILMIVHIGLVSLLQCRSKRSPCFLKSLCYFSANESCDNCTSLLCLSRCIMGYQWGMQECVRYLSVCHWSISYTSLLPSHQQCHRLWRSTECVSTKI